MEDEIESQVWRTAQQAYSKVSFARLLEEAVASFKRVPGLILSCGCTRYGSALRASGCYVML